MATPFAWSEIDDPELTARRWAVSDMPRRLSGEGPWKGALTHGFALAGARSALLTL